MTSLQTEDGRMAVITGGGTGIGLTCTKKFLELGCKFWALGKDREEEIVSDCFNSQASIVWWGIKPNVCCVGLVEI